jgi:ubiquinone/menaquinone biosynthesis C-methylase UbiE
MSGSVSFDPIADRYDATRGYPPEVEQQIAEGLVRIGSLHEGSTLLEIGIGTGRIALPVLAMGCNVTGVDISIGMVERLRAKYDALRQEQPERTWGTLRVEMADMTALPFASETFNAAVAVHVLHLVPQWLRAVDEVLRVVRPGGAFMIGQDVRLEDDVQWRMQSEWMEIVHGLGFPVGYVGAAGYSAVKSELQRRGLHPREEQIAAWEIEVTPSYVLGWIVERTWSRTWQVPTDIFDESARRLTAWAAREYSDSMDIPRRVPVAFKVTSVRR